MAAFRSAKTHVLQESVNNTDNVDGTRTKNASHRARKTTAGKTEPPPTAVARRNARERNRVKQVNNGFAALRQRIPDEIAEIYENANNNNRTTNKKLSKVETLRMAVEYIKSLESLLSFDRAESKENTNATLTSFPSPASSESLHNGSSFEQTYFSMLEDEDSNPPTPLPPVSSHRYSRIPGTNAFRLIRGPPSICLEDEENVHPPLTPNSDDILAVTQENHFRVDSALPQLYEDECPSPTETLTLVDCQQNLYYQTVLYHRQIPILTEESARKQPLSQENDNVAVVENILQHENVNVDGIKTEPIRLDDNFPREIQLEQNVDDMIDWWKNRPDLTLISSDK